MDQVGGGRRLPPVCLCSNVKGPPTTRTIGEGRELDNVSVRCWGVVAEESALYLVDQRFGGSIIPRVVLRGKWSEHYRQDR